MNRKMKSCALLLVAGVLSVGSAAVLRAGGGGAICCEYESNCPAEFPECHMVGGDCSKATTGIQGYCMNPDVL